MAVSSDRALRQEGSVQALRAVTFARTGHYSPMWSRSDQPCHVYPINDATGDAVCQLTWAYQKLSEPCVTFPNGRTSHECANEAVERFEDVLLDHLHIREAA